MGLFLRIFTFLVLSSCVSNSQEEAGLEEDFNEQSEENEQNNEANNEEEELDENDDSEDEQIDEEDDGAFEDEGALTTSEDDMLFEMEGEASLEGEDNLGQNQNMMQNQQNMGLNQQNQGLLGNDLPLNDNRALLSDDLPLNDNQALLDDGLPMNQSLPNDGGLAANNLQNEALGLQNQGDFPIDQGLNTNVPANNMQNMAQEPPLNGQDLFMDNPLPAEGAGNGFGNTMSDTAPPPGGMMEQETMEPVQEIVPTLHTLTWIGHEFYPERRQVQLELLTSGTPEFEVFQEKNQAAQPELVIRFFQTDLREKLRFAIDSSEFQSPVAYVRPRVMSDRGIVDIIITLRDAVQPKFFSQNSNIKLTFTIPEYYFGNLNKENIRAIRGERLADTQLGLILDSASELPKGAGTSQSRDLLPAGDDIEDVMAPESNIDDQGFPDSFNNTEHYESDPESKIVVIAAATLLAVGQDDGNDFMEQDQVINPASPLLLDQTSENKDSNKLENNKVNEPEDFTLGEGQKSDFPPPAQEAEPMDLLNESAKEFVDVVEEVDSVSPGRAGLEAAMENSDRTPMEQKLIYMEFTDAPLSIVFKSFSEETGNNFIFPKEVGDLTISIHFQGVPWDEALRAILETHSLGMVRVGKSIVRVDAVDRLTAYLQSLEKAQEFETRRAPTKILVFRLNNAKATDIVERLNTLLVRNKQIDPRIQISADERTNAVVMEAPDFVLAKTRNIIERLDLKTPQVEIASRIVEVQKTSSELFGLSWLNQSLLNFDPGRGLGFGSLNFPNNVVSSFSVDPGVRSAPAVGNAQFKFGSINRFIDLDLLLRMEERKGTTNVLQSNRVLVLDGQEATILAGNSKFFRPAAGGVLNPGTSTGGTTTTGDEAQGLSEVQFNLSLEVKPQVTADGAVIMNLKIKSDTPGAPTGEVLADKNTRELTTHMVRDSGDTGVIGGIYDTSRTETVIGIPYLSQIPILGALFRSTQVEESQTELLIMVTPTIVNGGRDARSQPQTSQIEDQFPDKGNL